MDACYVTKSRDVAYQHWSSVPLLYQLIALARVHIITPASDEPVVRNVVNTRVGLNVCVYACARCVAACKSYVSVLGYSLCFILGE
jgi:hypothetical protein